MAGGEFGAIVLSIDDQKIDTWKEYSFGSHFLSPTDAWWFKLGDEIVDAKMLQLLKPGSRVRFTINDKLQGNGFIDRVEISCSRTGGTEFTVSGRDVLSPVVDSQLPPSSVFEHMSLEQLLKKVLGDFGFSKFDISNEENINRATGRSKGRKKPNKKLGEYQVPHGKSHQNEGVFAFLTRITQRYGLWLWSSVDGDTIVVSKPDFDQSPRGKLTHKIGGATNNVLESRLCLDSTDQPSFIIAKGNIPPTEYERAVTSVACANQFRFNDHTGTKTSRAFPEFLQANSGTVTVEVPALPAKLINVFASSQAKPVWLRDDEAHTKEELEKFVLRELSLRVRKAFVANYTITGHELDGQPVCVDTVIDVDDDRMGIHQSMWVLSVNHRKSRQGQFTDIELIPLGTLVF